MNALVRKEVRSMLPTWLVAMALAILPVWLVWPGQQGLTPPSLGLLVFAPFAMGVFLLSLTPFGQELNWGTFSVLLSQPVSRRRLWAVKTVTLSVALICTFLALCISSHIRVDSALESMKHTVWRNAFDHPSGQTQFFLNLIAGTRRTASDDALLIGGLAVLAGFAGGLWTTLFFRQITAAFWVTVLVPTGLTIITSAALRNFSEEFIRSVLALLVGLYCVVGYLWAKRFFLRVPDTQWTGGTVTLPQWGLAGMARSKTIRRHKPLHALVRKELQSQQANVLVVGGLLLVHLATIAVRRWGSDYLATHRSMAMILEQFPLIWLVMPVLVGSVAVAEERKLGTFQSGLCLSVGKRAQFFSKATVAFGLGIVFGGVLPLLLEHLAGSRSLTGSPSGLHILGENRTTEFLQLYGSVGLALLAYYGSTLTRNALQAMGAGLLGVVAAGLLILGAQQAEFGEFILWRGRLIELIGWPVTILMVLMLAYRNSSILQPGWRTWARNGLTIIVGLTGTAILTTVIYHRAWEAWVPEEPLHRSGFSFFRARWNTHAPRLGSSPDRHGAGSYLGVTIQDLTPALARQFKLNGLNGVLVASVARESPAEKAGLKSGDLVPEFAGQTVSDSRQFKLLVAEAKSESRVPVEIVRDGETRTVEVTVGRLADTSHLPQQPRLPMLKADGSQVAALLPDGRLWLQQQHANPLDARIFRHGLRAGYATGRLHSGFVTASNWKDVALVLGGCVGIQTDGTLWDLSALKDGEPSLKRIGEDRDWATISAGWEHFCALKTDGTLWQRGWRSDPWLRTVPGEEVSIPVQVGTDDDWIAICDSGTMSAAIKRDGSVWRWDWTARTHNQPERWLSGVCAQPVSVSLSYDAIACVCSDGTLWIGGNLTNSIYGHLIGPELARRAAGEMVRCGNESDWQEIRFAEWDKVVGIKTDDSLWEWILRGVAGGSLGPLVQPITPSHYTDWLSIGGSDSAFLSLARDGTLCLWGDPEDRFYIDWGGVPDPGRLLMPSRIKSRRIADLSK